MAPPPSQVLWGFALDVAGPLLLAIGLLVGAALGVAGILLAQKLLAKAGFRLAREQAQEILGTARLEAETIARESEIRGKEDDLLRREAIDREAEAARKLLRDAEIRNERRADNLDEKFDILNNREREVEARQTRLTEAQQAILDRDRALDGLIDAQKAELHKIAGLDQEAARDWLFRRLEQDLASEIGERLQRHEESVRSECQQKARELLATAIQRYAAPHTAETTTSVVDIPSDDMKGRIIGREGRNIRAFEKITGVDLIVDDTPGIVIVTGFDNVRREVAKVALERLILDGRIHPARIEEIVAETQTEVDTLILENGRKAAIEVGLSGIHGKLLDYLGRLKFRTSYSQNVLRHSIEVAFLTGMLAEELKLDGELGRRCGLLHDVGKAADHEIEGGHPAIGADLCKRFGEAPEVVHAALGHHDDLRVDRPYTVLVAAADAISASRPGARRDSLEKYVRRLEQLEALVLGFPGVLQAYAIQAGREVRVLVDGNALDDRGSAKLCRDVADAIQQELRYPGEVKVTVLRETRVIEFAR